MLYVNHPNKSSYLLENHNDVQWFEENRKKKKRVRAVFDWEVEQYGTEIVGVVVTKNHPKGLLKRFFGVDHPLAKKLAASS